jgi:hypothetical protein
MLLMGGDGQKQGVSIENAFNHVGLKAFLCGKNRDSYLLLLNFNS